jgi:hypothetical protein
VFRLSFDCHFVIMTSELNDLSLQLQRAETELVAMRNKLQLTVEELNRAVSVCEKARAGGAPHDQGL